MNDPTSTQATSSQAAPPPAQASAPSKFYPAFFLSVFLGVFGAHRFYVRRIGTGLLQLVTFGGLGIWWLVDMIMILLGKFRDKSGAAIPNIAPKLSWSVFAIVVLIGLASRGVQSESSSSTGGTARPTTRSTQERRDPQFVGGWTTVGQVLSTMQLFPDGRASYYDGWSRNRDTGRWHSDSSRVTLELSSGTIRLDYESFNGQLEDGRSGNIFRK